MGLSVFFYAAHPCVPTPTPPPSQKSGFSGVRGNYILGLGVVLTGHAITARCGLPMLGSPACINTHTCDPGQAPALTCELCPSSLVQAPQGSAMCCCAVYFRNVPAQLCTAQCKLQNKCICVSGWPQTQLKSSTCLAVPLVPTCRYGLLCAPFAPAWDNHVCMAVFVSVCMELYVHVSSIRAIIRAVQ